MKREDDEQLWDLLGKSSQPKISPFFARNVLREIREPRRQTWLSRWLTVRRLVPAAGVAVAVIAASMLWVQSPAPTSPEPDRVAQLEAQDYEVIADLDELVASDDGNLWEDDSVLL